MVEWPNEWFSFACGVRRCGGGSVGLVVCETTGVPTQHEESTTFYLVAKYLSYGGNAYLNFEVFCEFKFISGFCDFDQSKIEATFAV